jgi:multidrug efflux pump subunit AcrB
MFPPVDGPLMKAQIEFPSGTPVEVTQAALSRMEEALPRVAAQFQTASGEPLIESVFSVAGSTVDPAPGQRVSVGSHIGALKVDMLKNPGRGIHSDRLITAWEKEVGHIPGLVSKQFSGDDSGPPGRPIEIWLQGESMDLLLAASEELIAELRTFDGVSQVESDFRPGKNEIRLDLKPSARALGLTVGDLARQVYAGFYGEEALRLQRGRDDIRVRVRYPREERSQLSELYNIRIRTPHGSEIPLRSVANLDYAPGYSNILRTNGIRRIAVSAQLDTTKTSSLDIVSHLNQGFFDKLKARHRGLSVAVQGEQKDTSESLGSLFVGYPLALLAIFFIIATTFRSYIQPLIILVTVPLGIIGAFLGHMIWGSPVTMFSIFGIVALAGVVVNDAIVLMECINSLVAQGLPFFEAIVQGGRRRFRAIFLTTISTCGGLAPMMLETERQTQFVIPMAISMTFGVAFATLLTLLLIPSLLAILNDIRCLLHWLRTQEWPVREKVEPASWRTIDPLELERIEEARAGDSAK